MKHFTLPALIWALAISHTFAQKHLAPGIEPYAFHWGYTVKQMLQAAGYEVPGPHAETDLRPQTDNRSEQLQLDSTITYFGYTSAGHDSIPMLRNVYQRPQDDLEIITESFFDHDSWVPLSRTSLYTDDLGRMIDAIAFAYDEASGTFLPDSRILVYPHGNSLTEVDSLIILTWNPEIKDYVRTIATWNEFDEAGHLVTSTSSIEIFEFPLIFKDIYTYHTDGKLALVESFNVEGQDLIPAGRQEYGYINGRLSSLTNLIPDGLGGYFPQSRIEYLYTVDGLQEFVKNLEWDFEKNDWKLVSVDAYGYDQSNRADVKESSALNDQGIWIRHKETYAYISDEYLQRTDNYSYDNNLESWILEDRKFYYYDNTTAVDPNEPLADAALFMYPNPTTGYVQVKLTGKIAVYVYTLSGQLVLKSYLAPGDKTLNLSSLPAGLYQVRAKSDDDYYSGKLIIQ